MRDPIDRMVVLTRAAQDGSVEAWVALDVALRPSLRSLIGERLGVTHRAINEVLDETLALLHARLPTFDPNDIEAEARDIARRLARQRRQRDSAAKELAS